MDYERIVDVAAIGWLTCEVLDVVQAVFCRFGAPFPLGAWSTSAFMCFIVFSLYVVARDMVVDLVGGCGSNGGKRGAETLSRVIEA